MRLLKFAARVLIGGLFFGHGTQKLKGWFDGPGLDGTEQMMKGMQMYPPRRNALAAGASEAGGGALLAAGLCTPLAGAALTGTMITAIRKVHLPNGPWNSSGGWEYNAVLIAAVLAIVEDGPGAASLDRLLRRERKGTRYALGALALGAAASAAAVELGRRSAPEVAPQQEQADPGGDAG